MVRRDASVAPVFDCRAEVSDGAFSDVLGDLCDEGLPAVCRYGSEWYALVVIGTIRLRLVAVQHQNSGRAVVVSRTGVLVP